MKEDIELDPVDTTETRVREALQKCRSVKWCSWDEIATELNAGRSINFSANEYKLAFTHLHKQGVIHIVETSDGVVNVHVNNPVRQ